MDSHDPANVTALVTDLHLIIIGAEKKQALFDSICRNIRERWAVRYPGMRCEEEAFTDDEVWGAGMQLTIRGAEAAPGDDTFGLQITATPLADDAPGGFDQFGLSALLRGAKKVLFLWLVPDEWLKSAETEGLLSSPFYKQLVSLEELLAHLKRSPDDREIGVALFQLKEKSTPFGSRPWMAWREPEDRRIFSMLRRKAPKVAGLLEEMLAGNRIHQLPWSTAGSHLDHAPRWIDRLIFQELKLPGGYTES